MKKQILDSPFFVYSTGRVKDKKGNEVQYYINEKGYRRVCLVWNNKRKWLKVSRLVAIAFLPNSDNKPTVNHKDGNRQNDHKDNLEWNTWSENHKHRFRELGRKPSGGLSIERREIVEQYKDNILINTFESLNEASRQTGIPLSNISLAANGKRKTAGKFIWKKLGVNIITKINNNDR